MAYRIDNKTTEELIARYDRLTARNNRWTDAYIDAVGEVVDELERRANDLDDEVAGQWLDEA